MIGFENQLEYFKLIGRTLKRRAECFVIGGSAMMFLGFKSSTKDVDLVFTSQKDRDSVLNVLEDIGFEKRSGKIILMQRKDERFDLFLNEIVSFKLSSGIEDRIREKHVFGNLVVKVISPEDIILLKSATDRVGDRVDAKNIIKTFSINWDIIIKESIWQMKNGKKIFPVFLYDFLEDLTDMNVNIPKEILKKLRKISEEEMVKVLKKHKRNV